jgi:hypothetical protein
MGKFTNITAIANGPVRQGIASKLRSHDVLEHLKFRLNEKPRQLNLAGGLPKKSKVPVYANPIM